MTERPLADSEHEQHQQVSKQHYNIASRQHGEHSPRKAGIKFTSTGKLRARLDADEWIRPAGQHRKGGRK